ncbi:MAG TPA: GLPGLI family protein [Salegentibacter sp.]|nr:GLPGLI family protein [Salegentibacter sp.]
MKHFYISCIFLFLSSLVQAQELTEKFKYKAIYELTWQIDSTDAESEQNERMVLFTGDGNSRFSSEGKHIGDSIKQLYKERDRTPQNFSEMRSKIPETKFKYYIDKILAAREINFKEEIVKDYYRYTEDLSDVTWEILPETKEISGFKVQKAKTNFAGRNYIAWFTSEIPISDGPYKFNGLPGLIVKIADENEYYVFELIGFKSLKDPIFDTESGEKYLETEKSRFLDIKREYNADPISAVGRMGITFGFEPGQKKKMDREHQKELKKENNPMELE